MLVPLPSQSCPAAAPGSQPLASKHADLSRKACAGCSGQTELEPADLSRKTCAGFSNQTDLEPAGASTWVAGILDGLDSGLLCGVLFSWLPE
ncbi:hypothetical protein DUNSADRAFT_7971 [Dunaliella salina]|uniref:Encoded protein n=1 Tax=Dunaliella salina TaxID=3046 RepID=A0ABQ7H629_DUNSA|nr:hypothetical protein DUNSADRAFT_7971 [Dunaliella salina]|eukprot:KAF5842318.1 hypothetical protein DUNSADRAFT_7971 [Dunaliella salina]